MLLFVYLSSAYTNVEQWVYQASNTHQLASQVVIDSILYQADLIIFFREAWGMWRGVCSLLALF